MNSIAVIAFTQRGCALAKRIAAGVIGADGFASARVSVSGPDRLAASLDVQPYGSLASWTAQHFGTCDALVYVGAAGIAVRAIAPHVRDKFTDPAVVSVDETGAFVVPLLSGHVGGANGLARVVAQITGGQAAVSTATDVNGMFAVDEWAARNDMFICERVLAKEVSARLLEGGKVGYWTDCWPDWDLPAGIVDARKNPGEKFDLGIAVSLDDLCMPFEHTLHLVPRVVTIGVGCRKGIETEVLVRHLAGVLACEGVSPRAVKRLASIDVKSEEQAILDLAAIHGWDLKFYTADELAAVPGEFESSEFVKRTVGVDNVCERAALAEGGRLLRHKHAENGTTLALAVAELKTGN